MSTPPPPPSALPPSSVVVPGSEGKPDAGSAMGVTGMKGGALILSPLPLGGGKRKTKRLSKKALKMLKKMTPKQLKALAKKGGNDGTVPTETPAVTGARRRKSRKTRRSGLLY